MQLKTLISFARTQHLRSDVTRSDVTRSDVTRSGVTRSGATRSGATRSGATRSNCGSHLILGVFAANWVLYAKRVMCMRVSGIMILLLCLFSHNIGADARYNCPISKTEAAQPPDDPNASPFPKGPWYINESRTVWAGFDAADLRTGGNKVLWIRPTGAALLVEAEHLDGNGTFQFSAPCCYPTGFQASGLFFDSPGCWKIEASAGDETLTFITKVSERGV